LTNHNNLQYFGKVHLGSDSKPFEAIFDTGSSNLWVPGPHCGDACKGHHVFHPVNHGNGYSGSVNYGTGKVDFETVKDTVRLCDKIKGCVDEQAIVRSENHKIGLAVNATPHPFKYLPFDGILGLGLGENSLFDSFISSDKTVPHIMGVYLSNDSKLPGSVSFGGIEKEHISDSLLGKDQLSWHKITDDKEWNIKLVDFAVNGKRLHLCEDHYCDALVDTGSSLITGPSTDLSLLQKEIENSYQGPVDVILSDKNGQEISYRLNKEDYMIKFKDGNQSGFGPLDFPSSSKTHGKWVLGDTFLRRFYSIFDGDHKQVGFVTSKHENEDIGVLTRSVNRFILLMPGWKPPRVRYMMEWKNFI
jgi:cathepsin D